MYHKPFLNISKNIKNWVNVPVIIGGFKDDAQGAVCALSKGLADAVEIDDKVNINSLQSQPTLINNEVDFVPSYYWVG